MAYNLLSSAFGSIIALLARQTVPEEVRAALTAVSTFDRAPATSLDAEVVDRMRTLLGGQLAPAPVSQPRWYLKDLETAQRLADGGQLSQAAKLWRACQGDGVIRGVLSTRTDGLVRLPKVFKGAKEMCAELESGGDSIRSVFDEMFPPAELAALAADGIGLGVGVGELLPVPGRDFPVFVRLDPEFLSYRRHENRWYYRSIAGDLPITPGDGRWVLHLPGGRLNPWNQGIYRAVGGAYIRKEHAQIYDGNWQSKLANPARVAVSPQGGAEPQKQEWFQAVLAWGVNSVFGVHPGYDVKLVESNGRGSESFDRTILRSDRQSIIAIAGQEVTTDGGAGFQNSDIHSSIRADLIKGTADALAYTINTQGLPVLTIARYGVKRLDAMSAIVEWDVTPPSDRQATAQAMMTMGQAITAIDTALEKHGLRLDIDRVAEQYGIPTIKLKPEEKLALVPDVGAPAESDEAEQSEAEPQAEERAA